MTTRTNRRPGVKAKAAIHTNDHDYSALLTSVSRSFSESVNGHNRLFLTDASGLNELYLKSLLSDRQAHDCHACRRFIEVYGGLVAITDTGETIPLMWNPTGVPELYHAAFTALHARVKKARVISPFLSNQTVWGTPVTGTWSHMAVKPAPSFIYSGRVLTPSQVVAAAKESFRNVATALIEFTAPMLDEALRLLTADALARSEKFIGPVKWLRTLHDRPKGRIGENILWLAIATAPEGYCHPKASVVGPLLDDIASGMAFADIKARFEAKIHPLLYQRPQVNPTAGNIKAAEELVAKLGIGPSLERRFARADELVTVWQPKVARQDEKSGGVFGHIKPKDSRGTIKPVDMPAITMTWDKFTRTVLSGAEQMEIHIPMNGRFIALTTAVNFDAPAILKWDREDSRNPVAWYVYPNGSRASQWGLRGGEWAKITMAVPFPTLWGDKPAPHLGDGVVLVIEGALDTNDNSGNALFPECLRDDLHGIRSTVEAYSRHAKLSGREDGGACGYDIRKGGADCNLRVYAANAWTTYRIDRWD